MNMKKTFKFLTLTVLLSMVGVVSALAQKITGTTDWDGDVQYKVTAIRVLSGVVKEATVSVVDNATPKAGVTEVTIPSKVTLKVSGKTDNNVTISAKDVEFTVTEISNYGYGNKNDVQKINIPATVKKIGASAFHNYASQSNINLQIVFEAGSELESIGDFAFGNCAAKKIDLSNCNSLDLTGTTPFLSAGSGENQQLQEVILPNGIKKIGTAFANLPKLTSLDLSKTKVTVLEDGALAGTALTEVTIPAVKDPTVLTTKIGKGAFPATVKKLTINAPIAAEGAIDPEAFIGMTDLEELTLNGELDAVGAIPSNAFPNSSKLNKVIVNGEVKKAGAIADNAFAGNNNISEVTFSKPVWAGGIGQGAFAGIGQDDCAKVNFSTLQGAAAIGYEAFKGAGISELTFNGAIAEDAISMYAFQNITCGAVVEFKGTIGVDGIGMYAFQDAYLSTLTFDKHIDNEEAIAPFAFYRANITAITFKKPVRASYGIGNYAFFAFKNDKGTTPVLFEDGGIRDANGIGEHAFDKGAVGSLTINGNLKGASSIGAYAFANTPIAEFTLTGEVANTNAIDFGAFAFTKNLAKIDLQGNIYTANGGHAISAGAFFAAGTDTPKGAELNIGNLKMTDAIEAGAFASAKLDVVNFSRLMAVHAIADKQFGAMNLVWSRQEGIDLNKIEEDITEIRNDGEPASINTVNFNEEFKAWPEAYDNASNNFVGNNAFTGTKVSEVNFNAPVSVEHAIWVPGSVDKFNDALAKKGPFAFNGAPMTINFNSDVVSKAFGPYAFAYSNTTVINLDESADFQLTAFRNFSFYAISWTGEAGQNVVINYAAPAGVTDRAFAQRAFYTPTEIIDIYFKTTKEVLDLYTAENNASDLTPYRIKGLASKYIEVIRQPDGTYAGIFSPENEMYVIEKYQESGAEVGVWSAYADDLTLEATGDQFIANGRDKYKADLYINPLRVQDKGKYVLNAGHTLIVTAENAAWTEPIEKVIATQDLGKHKDGGVQTFAGLSPWACNDLRWNPAESNSNNWGGYVNWAAIDNGDKDIYGNVVRDYELFRQYNFATQGLGFGNSINIPEDQAYILVASLGAEQVTNRIKYSEYDHNAEWFTKNGISWEKSVAELIADAVALAVAGETEATDKYNGLIEKLQKAAGTDDEPSTLTDEDALIAAVMQKIIDQHLSENKDLQDEIIKLADELLPLVKNYAKALCDLRNAKEAVDRLNRIPAAEEEVDPYNFAGKFSDYLDRINSSKEALQDDIDELDEYLTVAAGDEQGDDMYKKYLALKDLAGNAAEGQALYDEFINLPSPVQDVLAASPADRKNTRVTGYTGDYQMVKALEEMKQTYYDFRDKYLAWTGENPDPRNSFTFDVTKLQESELDLDAADALFPDMTQDNIDLPSNFYKTVEEAYLEQKEKYDAYTAWDKAYKAAKDNEHVMAAFDNTLWIKKDHYDLNLWTGEGVLAENDEDIDIVLDRRGLDYDYYDGDEYRDVQPFKVTKAATYAGFTFDVDDVYGVVETAYATTSAGIINQKKIVLWNADEYEWQTINAPYATLLLEPNDVKEFDLSWYNKADPGDNSEWHSLYVGIHNQLTFGQNIFNFDGVTGETKLYADLGNALFGLLKNGLVDATLYETRPVWYLSTENSQTIGYDTDTSDDLWTVDLTAITDPTADYETAKENFENWPVAWYKQADEIHGQNTSFDITYNKEMQKLADQKAIAALDAELAALMDIKDPYDGTSACQNYLDAVETLGTPAKEDDETTTDVDETAAATGAYLAVDTAKEAKDAKVDELKDVVNGIEVSSARLNIIWNDGSHGDVVGIMESVVKNSATEAGNNAIYNLNGMRVKNAGKGIYIQNGKKFIK